LRKTDWHDYEGIKWLLGRGVDPNRRTRWGKTALHNAVLSDNAIEIFEVLLDHGADPTIIADRPDRSDRTFSGKSAVAMAARRGVAVLPPGGRLFRGRAGQPGAARRGLARAARGRAAADRARRAGECEGRQRADPAGPGRQGVRGLVLDRAALARVRASAARGRSVPERCPLSVRVRGG